MKVLYLHQYFRTPEQGGALRSYYLCTALVNKGVEVEMITAHNSGSYEKKHIDGITVHYLPIPYDNKFGFLHRVWSFIVFAYKSYQLAKTIPDIDLCYATSTPLTVGWAALKLKRKFSIPYYFEVRDSWPEAPVQMGVIKNNWLKRWLYAFELKVYENANILVALSPGIKKDILSKTNKPVMMLPNISDCAFYDLSVKNPAFEDMFGVKGKFVLSYTGAVGVVNHLEFLLDIAQKCAEAHLDDLVIFIAGEGAKVENLKVQAKKMNLKNVRFTGFLQRNDLKKLMNITDATYTSFLKLPVLETNSPNKFFDSLASGKLTIVNSLGWTKELVENNYCGFYADPEKSDEFVSKVRIFMSDPSVLSEYQQNARTLAQKEFSRDLISKKFTSLFEEAEVRKHQKSIKVYNRKG